MKQISYPALQGGAKTIKTMKIFAIPVENGILNNHFGHTRQFALVAVEGSQIISDTVIDAPAHQPGLLPRWLADVGTTDVIVGGIGQQAVAIFEAQNIKVHIGARQKNAIELVNDYINEKLIVDENKCDH
ncbi:MAG: ATPase [Chlorobi bacterium]|nr:ATPase [Chlorobiota bacterium]